MLEQATWSTSVMTLEQQADLVEQCEVDTLLFCQDAWAMRHRFINEQTGEVIRARCDSWRCLYCGPRKVDQWRQMIKVVEPKLFITFTRVGRTVEEASRVLTTIMQFLRRGSRGKGPHRIGERLAYPVEWFAVLERHSDFEHVGFHWHVLVNNLDYIPHEHLKEALISATTGLFRKYGEKPSEIVHVEGVRSGAVGYVTKYLTKQITVGEQGTKTYKRLLRKPVLEVQASYTVVRQVAGADGASQGMSEERPYLSTSKLGGDGKPLMEVVEEMVERVSKARRIRYSRRFFPLRVEEMRRRLFAGLSLSDEANIVDADSVEAVEAGRGEEELEGEEGRPGWVLREVEKYSASVEAYEARRRRALVDALEEIRAGRRLSRRVMTIWSYQQSEHYRE